MRRIIQSVLTVLMTASLIAPLATASVSLDEAPRADCCCCADNAGSAAAGSCCCEPEGDTTESSDSCDCSWVPTEGGDNPVRTEATSRIGERLNPYLLSGHVSETWTSGRDGIASLPAWVLAHRGPPIPIYCAICSYRL
ncbi:MAG: hypothetical protein O3A51_04130 [Verrucomicrobia bacterium]|nr:hypothetical protein [Verrucomicrobiota bacterium]